MDIYKDHNIPTYNADLDTWDVTTFSSREEFRNYLQAIFKEPGKYEFNETSRKFNEQGNYFLKNKFYCSKPFKSKDYITYWDSEKEKNRKGVIFISGKHIWYLPREYYMWLNFLPIYDKTKKIYTFPEIYDTQYHMALYEFIAELRYEHASILKKRQIASSYFHAAKLLNQFWFEQGARLKMGASLKKYVNSKGTWQYLQEYANHLNQHTAWVRPIKGSAGAWEQKIEVRKEGRNIEVGLKSLMEFTSFEKDATAGVGGPATYFFHEEAGIAPKMMDTYEYMRPALQDGMITTGQFIAAGSVGDLDQCGPLKEFILRPERYQMFAVEDNLLDKEGTTSKHALFIPEQWSMRPHIDEYGNSQVDEALKAILLQREEDKKLLSPEQYQLRISQKPTNIEEAFNHRKDSPFPLHLIAKQRERIKEGLYPYERIELYKTETGVEYKTSNKAPILQFPVDKKMEDKTGVLQVWEKPSKNTKFGSYYASIDPVSEGKTTTSDSLCSIYVYKADTEVTRKLESGEMESFVEPGKIVAAWTGRFDDINKTHERLELIIEWYNAWAIVENNISLFIQYMIHKRKQKYLVPKDQIMFLKELKSNMNVFQEYGWKNTGTLFKAHLLSYGIEFLTEEIDQETKEDGTVVKTTYGIERIPDDMLLEEMTQYYLGLNVDRLVTYCALVSFIRIQQSNRGFNRRNEDLSKNKLENSKNLYKLNVGAFRNLGQSKKNSNGHNKHKNAFRNYK